MQLRIWPGQRPLPADICQLLRLRNSIHQWCKPLNYEEDWSMQTHSCFWFQALQDITALASKLQVHGNVARMKICRSWHFKIPQGEKHLSAESCTYISYISCWFVCFGYFDWLKSLKSANLFANSTPKLIRGVGCFCWPGITFVDSHCGVGRSGFRRLLHSGEAKSSQGKTFAKTQGAGNTWMHQSGQYRTRFWEIQTSKQLKIKSNPDWNPCKLSPQTSLWGRLYLICWSHPISLLQTFRPGCLMQPRQYCHNCQMPNKAWCLQAEAGVSTDSGTLHSRPLAYLVNWLAQNANAREVSMAQCCCRIPFECLSSDQILCVHQKTDLSLASSVFYLRLKPWWIFMFEIKYPVFSNLHLGGMWLYLCIAML